MFDMVEHLDGSSGMIVRRGSNYVSYETEDGLIKKAWYDLQEGPEYLEKGQPAPDKHSDLYTDENPNTIKPTKDVATANHVAKIKSGRTHAHKIICDCNGTKSKSYG